VKTPSTVCFNLCFSVGLLLLPVAQAAPTEPATPPTIPDATAKPYVLFMRTDVAVEQNKKLYPVKDVHGQKFIITVKGQPVSVSMSGEGRKLEFQHALTLARASASLTGLESGRAYTARRDPKMKRQRDAVIAEAVIGDNASLAEGQWIRALNKDGILINSDPRMPDGTPIQGAAQSAAAQDASSAAAAARAFEAMNQMESLRQSNITSGGFARLQAEADMALENFDAVEVRFDVASSVYLEKPYVVVITRFHARDDKPGVARNAVFAKALEAIGTKPTRVELLHGGFPLGFEIEDLQVHLYNEGKEIPTDVAQKRVPLTREEAFEYLKIDYFRDHKGETMPATPAVGRPDRLELARLGPKQLEAAYFVKVDKAGHPGGVFIDEKCSQPADEAVATLAREVRYYPALEQGKAVDGVARLILSHLEF
jgi:hypothetical protein